jgi:hypothetical protein
MEAASIVATEMEKGLSVQAAIAEAERILYGRLFPGLVAREQHGSPQH